MSGRLVWVNDLDLWLPESPAEPSSPSAEDVYIEGLETFGWGDAVDVLTPKQRFVIERRRGLLDGVSYTLSEIASVMGVSHQAVWKLERAALKKLGQWVEKRVEKDA